MAQSACSGSRLSTRSEQICVCLTCIVAWRAWQHFNSAASVEQSSHLGKYRILYNATSDHEQITGCCDLH